jgi:DNA repair exonuclease SbcCD ATPase subunit
MQIATIGINSKQSVIITKSETKGLEEIIKSLKEILSQQQALQPQYKNDLQAEIQTIEGQLNSSKPKTKIIMESLSSAKTILQNISDISVTIAPIITKIGMWMHGME